MEKRTSVAIIGPDWELSEKIFELVRMDNKYDWVHITNLKKTPRNIDDWLVPISKKAKIVILSIPNTTKAFALQVVRKRKLLRNRLVLVSAEEVSPEILSAVTQNSNSRVDRPAVIFVDDLFTKFLNTVHRPKSKALAA